MAAERPHACVCEVAASAVRTHQVLPSQLKAAFSTLHVAVQPHV